MDKTLQFLAFYVVPIGIGVVTVVALIFWPDPDGYGRDVAVPLHVLVQSDSVTPLEGIRQDLRETQSVTQHDTKLSTDPVWFLFHPKQAGGNIIEFPSRHATAVRCWDASTLSPLGSASRGRDDGMVERSKAGFILRSSPLPAEVLCRGTFVGPARLTVTQWESANFATSVSSYHRHSGLVDGGLIVLASFVLVTALINREKLYLVLAGWLICSLRVGGLSAGWDIQWLGQAVPEEWLSLARSVNIILYGIGLVTLYRALLGNADIGRRNVLLVTIVQWLCLPMLVAAVLLPYGVFLPVLWTILVAGFSVMTIGLLRVMLTAPSRATAWFAGAFALTFGAALAEVASAALGVREILNFLNNVTSALGSGVLASLAVAEKMRLETEKRLEAQGKLERAYAVLPLGLVTLDLSGAFVSANPAAMTKLALSSMEPGKTHWGRFFHERDWAELKEKASEMHEAEMHMTNLDRTRHFLVRATLARGRIEAVLQDVTDKHLATEKLRFLAQNDPLTSVFNRRGIEACFDDAIALLRAGRPLAIAYVDLDRFRLINDMFGHAAGDEVLKQVCQRIELLLGGGQKLGRLGGDEFVIVMPDTAIGDAARTCLEIIDYLGDKPYQVGGKSFNVRASIGLVEASADLDMKTSVSVADRACRKAKEARGSGLVTWPIGSSALAEHDFEQMLVKRLSGPSGTSGLFLEMQPIMSVSAPHTSLNFEVLLRLRDPDGQAYSGAALVAAAERNGGADIIDRWVLSSTLAWMDAHSASLPATQFVCVNLSGSSLGDERFVAEAAALLDRYAHVARWLCVEIAESVVLRNIENARRFIDLVQQRGAKVALDNFGAGRTSFAHLAGLPVDVLKIDGSFVTAVQTNPDSALIIEAIVNLARNLGIKTIAQWVDDIGAIKILSKIGVDYVQGFAVSRPQPPERIRTALSAASFIGPMDRIQLAPIFYPQMQASQAAAIRSSS